MKEYMIFYRTKDGELLYNWWSGSTLESAIDSANYDLQNDGEVDVKKTLENVISDILTEKYDMEESEVENVIDELIYRLAISTDGIEEAIDEYMDR